MPNPEPTDIRIDERGDEMHESWLMIRANRVSSHPGAKLFDSEIRHQHHIRVTVTRCTRKRDLQRDWLYGTKMLIEIDMSEAQWGAFVSSFGSSGVPATLSWFDGSMIPGVLTNDSRLDQSHKDVQNAAAKGIEEVKAAQRAVDEAFERNAGKREMRELFRTLKIVTDNLPSDMEFAARSLTEHTENVVQKARADIESMTIQAYRGEQELESGSESLLGSMKSLDAQ